MNSRRMMGWNERNMERKRRGYGLAFSSGRARIIGMLQSEMIPSQVWGGLYPPIQNGAFVKHKLNRNEQICELKPAVGWYFRGPREVISTNHTILSSNSLTKCDSVWRHPRRSISEYGPKMADKHNKVSPLLDSTQTKPSLEPDLQRWSRVVRKLLSSCQ